MSNTLKIPNPEMHFAYCSNCNGDIILERGKMNLFLIVFLLFFTFGLGDLIYFWINLKKPKKYCSNCGKKLEN